MTWKRSCGDLTGWACFAPAFVIAFSFGGCSSTPTQEAPLAPAGGTGGRGGANGSAASGGSSGQSNPGAGGDWCSALAVLRNNCQGCHGPQPLFGAPMPLVSIDHLRARAITAPAKFVYELVNERIHDTQKPMPPRSTNDMLTPAEMATLDAWIAGGAQPSSSACSAGGVDAGSGTGGQGGAGGTGAGGKAGGLGGGASGSAGVGGQGGAGGAGGSADGGTQPPGAWPADCQQRYTFRAHGVSQPGDTTKFNVSGAPTKQFYQCFLFKAPWGTDAVQALRFHPLIDDARVIHHWILYGTDTGTGPDGQVGGFGCSTGAFLQGWAPGGTDNQLPPDVGLEMPRGASAYLGLEIHYNNLAGYPDALDASGVEFCTTQTFRPNTASVHWLGSNLIAIPARTTRDVVSTCDPVTTAPVHILGTSPHMHQLGVHAKLILNRSNGTKETMHDAPFSFADQQSYPSTVIVNNGDTLTTTCTYNNTTSATVTFGPNTENEMCYNFVTAWPAGALSGPGGANRCLQ